MNIPGGGVPETHEFRFKVSPMFMRMDGLRDGTDNINSGDLLGMPVMMGQPTGKFMAVPTDMDMSMLNLAMGYSFSDDFFAGMMLMWKDNDMTMKFNDMMSMPVAMGGTGKKGFTMESSGMADTMLMAKYRLYTDDPLVPTSQSSLFMGLSLPTGSINEKNSNHPVLMRKSEQLPYSMQLGSGTFDPSIGLLYQGSSSPNWWGVNAMFTARLYDNSRDYRLGDVLTLDLYGMHQLRHDLVSQLQLNLLTMDQIGGEMDEAVSGASGRVTQDNPSTPYMTPLWDTDNYGGTKITVTAGLQWQPAPLNIVEFDIGIPVYQDLNGPQLEDEYKIMLTWYRELPSKASIRHSGKSHVNNSKLGF